MLRTPSVSEDIINSWPVSEAGLPPRVVHSVQNARISTVGQLHAWQDRDLLQLHALGRKSLEQIHFFFGLCGQLADETLSFKHITDLLQTFLDEDELSTLSLRFGFDLANPVPSAKALTLQQIGGRTNRTRERIRQIEETAMQKLQSNLCRSCLVPYTNYFASMIAQADECMTCTELLDRVQRSVLNFLNPCSILLLLTLLDSSKITYRKGFYSIWPAEHLDEFLTSLQHFLASQHGIADIQRICQHLRLVSEGTPDSIRKHASIVAGSCPAIAATIDERFFSGTEGWRAFITEVLEKFPKPANYKEIARIGNSLLKPASRKGSGFYLAELRNHPDVACHEIGIYGLK